MSNLLHRRPWRPSLVVVALGALSTLSACDRLGDGRVIGERRDDTRTASSTSGAAGTSNATASSSDTRVSGAGPDRPASASMGEARDAAREAGRDLRDAASSAGTAISGAASAAKERIDDAQVVARVKTGLSADKDLSALRLNVDATDGVVTLRGRVPSADARRRAVDIARNAKDVRQVRDELSVDPAARPG